MANAQVRTVGTTSGGKTLEMYNIPNTALLGLRFREGGELPDDIKDNRWATITDVQRAGEAYLKQDASKPKRQPTKKVKENVETGCDD